MFLKNKKVTNLKQSLKYYNEYSDLRERVLNDETASSSIKRFFYVLPKKIKTPQYIRWVKQFFI